MRTIASASALLLGLLAAACNGEVVGGGQRPTRVEVVSGDLQADTVGKEVAHPLVVRVVDARDKPVRNQLVNFVVTAGGGSVFAGSAITNADGEARERWTLGTVAGDTQRVEARAVDPSTGQPIVFATFRAIGVPDVPAAASAVGATSRTGAAGTAIADSLAIRVVDKHGNGVPGVAVTFAAANGGGVSPASTVTRADGTARAQWTLGPAAGPQTATATAAGFPAITFTATVSAGAVARVALAPEAISFSALGQTQALTVQAFDAFGNLVGGQQAMIVSQNDAVVALDAGAVARATGNGTARVIATVQGSTAADTTLVTVQQVVTRVIVNPTTATLLPGQTVQIAASAYDAGGALVANAAFTWASNSAAVTVNGSGLATAVSATDGATVTVSAGGASATATIVVEDILRAASISAGSYHACALDTSGRAYCWGLNGEAGGIPTGQAGGPDACRKSGPNCYTTATAVGGSLRFKAIGTYGAATCALTTAGAAYCTGPDNRLNPVPGSVVFAAMSTGQTPFCGLTEAGEAYCWSLTAAPVRQAEGFTFKALAVSATHSCGLVEDGSAFCWGNNTHGQLGDGTTTNRAQPVAVAGGLKFASITTGSASGAPGHTASTSCGVTTAGVGYCWGGETGSGTWNTSSTPVQVAGGHSWRVINAGTSRVCGVTTANAAYCWGVLTLNGTGLVSSSSNTPAAVPGDFAFSTVESGDAFSCGIDTAGRGRCWGYNLWGQLGNGTTADSATPVYVRIR